MHKTSVRTWLMTIQPFSIFFFTRSYRRKFSTHRSTYNYIIIFINKLEITFSLKLFYFWQTASLFFNNPTFSLLKLPWFISKRLFICQISVLLPKKIFSWWKDFHETCKNFLYNYFFYKFSLKSSLFSLSASQSKTCQALEEKISSCISWIQ